MPDFEFEFNQQDKELVVTQDDAFLTEEHYIRLTVYPTEAINTIVDLPNSDNGIEGKAIFFATLKTSAYEVNISPFTDNQENLIDTIVIGGDDSTIYPNDFKIYQNPDGTVYLKPNEIFNKFELPQGNYRIQIDFLKQEEYLLPFVIKQISTSRKEVRLKVLDTSITNDSPLAGPNLQTPLIDSLINEFNSAIVLLNFVYTFLSFSL